MKRLTGRMCEKKVAELKRRLGVKTDTAMINELARYYITQEANKEIKKRLKKKS